jgi:hypothetical protein
MKKLLLIIIPFILLMASCQKSSTDKMHYFQVGMKIPYISLKDTSSNWRDTSFVIATSNKDLLAKINFELSKPISDRKNVIGNVVRGNGGYNQNGSHSFKWHMDENTWDLTQLSVELYDGRPYSDIDLHTSYWIDTVGRYCSWSSYIKKEITQ